MSDHTADTSGDSPDGLGRRQQLLEFALAQAPVILYITNLDDDVPMSFVSANVERITGHKAEDFLSSPEFVRGLFHPDDLPGFNQRVRALGTTGDLSYEHRFRSASGETLWFRHEIRLATGGTSSKDQVVGCMVDITAEKEADARLRTAEGEREHLSRLLQDAIEALPSGFSINDSQGRLIMCNAAFAARYGVTPAEMVDTDQVERSRKFFEDVKEIDGKPIAGSDEDLKYFIDRVRRTEVGPIEVQLKNGTWFLITASRTSDGGTVRARTDITKQKNAELALRESEQHFRRIVEGHPLPVWMVDIESAQILYESPAAAELMGREWPSREPCYTTAHFANPEERALLNERLLETGDVRDVEVQFKKADGTLFWAVVHDRLIGYPDGRISITSFVDLTERKERELELRQAREVLEDAIESFPEGFALWDADFNLVLCNRRYREMNQLSADMLFPGAEWLAFMRKGAERGQYMEAVGRVEEFLDERLRNRDPSSVRPSRGWEFQQSDGRWYHAFTRYTRQGSIVLVRIDITERKEMELALRESEELIRRVLEACPVPVQMTRPSDGKIIYVSPATNELFDAPPDEQATTAKTYYADTADRGPYLAALRERGSIDDYEVQLKRWNGTRFWATVSARMIEYNGEDVIVSSIKDLTERLAMEEEMARQRETLHQSEKLSAMGELLAGVAHELNNPLSVVAGQALLMQETAPDERTAKRAEKIGRAAERCARIVKTFLAMARQEPTESKPVDLNDIIDSALEVAGYSLRSSDIDVSVLLDPKLPPVLADANQLSQVLTNLIVNAQHALGEKDSDRKLIISTEFDAGRKVVKATVQDNGPGIPPEVRSRIFEPLFTTKEIGVGTGIGLAVCHRIVVSHGGEITVESVPNEHTDFTIELPVTRASTARQESASDDGERIGNLSVLIIDDEPDVADLLAEILRNDGHDVEIANSGTEALAKLENHDYELILSDLRMPDLDGPGLYRALERRNRALLERIAFVTGDTVSPKARLFLESVGRPYLEKPISIKALRGLVDEMWRSLAPAPSRDG
jgi:PAS domain S-box-containing protein